MERILPGSHLEAQKMPGHWLLARLGKRVLRPGGREMTRQMLRLLDIGPADAVVEFAPGMGATARLALERRPASYIAVERDANAAARLQQWLASPYRKCVQRSADATGLMAESASIVYGEAMLSMQTAEGKRQIAREAARLLRPGGRYALHELCLLPDGVPDAEKRAIENALTQAIHVGARPLTPSEWRGLLEAEGFTVREQRLAPMHLLEPLRLLQDEGLAGALRFALNLLRDREARARVLAMRSVFRRYRRNLGAILLLAERLPDGGSPEK